MTMAAKPAAHSHQAACQRPESSRVPQGATWQAPRVLINSGCWGAHRLATTMTTTPAIKA